MPKSIFPAKLIFAVQLCFALLLSLNACSLQTDPEPAATVVSQLVLVASATPLATVAPSPTPVPLTTTPVPSDTFTPTATRSATPTWTATVTQTPTFTLTPDLYAPQSVLGGARRLSRSSVLNIKVPAPMQISPAFFGLNYWTPKWGSLVRDALAPLHTVILRYGGENYENEPLDYAELDRFILDARAMNVEPLIQVPYSHSTPKIAAAIVRYMNVQHHYDVRFWSIGNEEDNNGRTGSEEKWINSWRSFRDAMKAVDPQILIFGPDFGHAYDFTHPDNDWLTPFLKVNGDAVDVISLHRYPFNGGQTNPTVLIGDSFRTAERIRALRDHIKSVTGRDIPLAFTEMNLSDNWREGGEGSSESFSAGLWMAETLGQMAEAGVAMVDLWNATSPDSLGLLSKAAAEKRPTYYAALLYSTYGDRLVPLASHASGVTAHASRDSRTGIVTIVLVNRSKTSTKVKLDFNSNQVPQQGSIYFDLSALESFNYKIPPQSMASFTFDSGYNVIRTIVYSRSMYDQSLAPQVTP